MKKDFTAEEILSALQEVEKGTPIERISQKLGIEEQTFKQWRKDIILPDANINPEGTSDVPDIIKSKPLPEEEWALKHYDTLMRYFSYEGTIYWSRSQHFLVANSLLFGFVVTSNFNLDYAKTSDVQFFFLSLICVAGFFWQVFGGRLCTLETSG